MSKTGGDDSLVFYQPIKPGASIYTTGSSSDILDRDPSAESGVATPSFEPVLSEKNLSIEMSLMSKAHKRPLTANTYDKWLDYLKIGEDEFGQPIYKYQQAAIARAIKENFMKFSPRITYDPIIDDKISETLEIDVVFRDKYYSELERLRKAISNNSLSSKKLPLQSEMAKWDVQHPMLKYGVLK